MQSDKEKQLQAAGHFQALLPIGRAVAQSEKDERFAYAYGLAVGMLASPDATDLDLALSVNQRMLGSSLVPLARLRNLYVGALLRSRTTNTDTAVELLQEVIDTPAAYGWSEILGDTPFLVLRESEDLLVRLCSIEAIEIGAERVYRQAIEKRQTAELPDPYQIVLAKKRLAGFLLEHGKSEDARSLLNDAQQALRDAPVCFDWLRRQVQHDL